MNENDLSARFQEIKPDDIRLPVYKDKLRSALIFTGTVRNRKSHASLIPNRLASAFRGQRPVWQMALVAVLAVAFTAGFTIGVPAIAKPSDQEIAKKVALESECLHEAMAGRDKSDIDPDIGVELRSKGKATVSLQSKEVSPLVLNGSKRIWSIDITVDLANEEVLAYGYLRDMVTDEEIALMRDILTQDSRTASLMTGGAEIIIPFNSFIGVFGYGNLKVDEKGNEQMIKTGNVNCGLKLESWEFDLRVDLVNSRIMSLAEPEFSLLSSEELGQMMTILRASPETKALLDAGGAVTRAAVPKIVISGGVQKAVTVQAIIELGDKKYEAMLDMPGNTLTRVTEVGSAAYYEGHSPPPLPATT